MRLLLLSSLVILFSLVSNARYLSNEQIPDSPKDLAIETDLPGYKNIPDVNIYIRKKVTYRGQEFAVVYNRFVDFGGRTRLTKFVGVCKWENSEQMSTCHADEDCNTMSAYNQVLEHYDLHFEEKKLVCKSSERKARSIIKSAKAA